MRHTRQLSRFHILTASLVVVSVFAAAAGPAQARSVYSSKTDLAPIVPAANAAVQETQEILSASDSTPVDIASIRPGSRIDFHIPNETLSASEKEFASVEAVDTKDSTVAVDHAQQSLMTILRDGERSAIFKIEAPAEYMARVEKDGTVALVSNSGKTIPFIKKPWAKDATGKSLQTYYKIAGNQIIQEVDTRGAVYPVVADPSVQWKPSPYLALYGIQADILSRQVVTVLYAAGAATCVAGAIKLSGWVAQVFGLVCGLVGLSGVKDAFNRITSTWSAQPAQNPYQCYGIRIAGFGPKIMTLPARDCSW